MVDKLIIYVCPVQRCAMCSFKPNKKCPKHFDTLKPEKYIRTAVSSSTDAIGDAFSDIFGKFPPRK